MKAYELKTSYSHENRTCHGKVTIVLNHHIDYVRGTNASTHDDFTKQIPIHRITSYIEEDVLNQANTKVEDEVPVIAAKMIQKLIIALESLAKTDPKPSIESRILDLGFKPITAVDAVTNPFNS